jgi:adenylate cyclase class 1
VDPETGFAAANTRGRSWKGGCYLPPGVDMREPARKISVRSETLSGLEPDPAELKKIKRRFLLLNRERISRVRESLWPRQRIFLDLLPLIFHTNHPLMPGYVGRNAPHGVSEYTPDKRTLLQAAKQVKSFPVTRRALHSVDIYAIFLMGSSGTIAHSARSDLDVWLCHRADLSTESQAALREKALEVTRWAGSLGLDVHIYPVSVERFTQRDTQALSAEDSGSSQHHLLLDEFYRTGLLVAGRYPVWWLVPPQFEHHYGAYVRILREQRFIKDHEYIDFGPVADLPATEFLGATLWQMFKAVRSPYKSVLKILLLESYATEYPRPNLLCARYKRAVYSGERNAGALDPYVLLERKVEEYLTGRSDSERLQLARRCFYFKVNERLSLARRPGRLHWRRELAQDIVRQWGWSDAVLQALDSQRSWKIDRVLEERESIVKALTQSYQALSRFARQHADVAMISERDMTLLGRKLFTVFEHKAGKVQIVNQGISQDLSEGYLSIHQASLNSRPNGWLLFRGTVKRTEVHHYRPLRRFRTLVELIAWSHFNGLLTERTRVLLEAVDAGVSVREIEAIQQHLNRYFSRDLVRDADIGELSSPPRLLAASTFIDLGIDPLASFTQQGKHLTTNHSDALSYSGWHKNLVQLVDYLVVTSWREVFTFQFVGIDGLMACLCEHLRWIPRANRKRETTECHCYQPGYGESISRRIAELFDSVTEWFFAVKEERKRYIVRGGDRYYVLLAEESLATHEFAGSESELLAFLGRPNPVFTPVRVDPHALDSSPLPCIYDANSKHSAQIFFQRLGTEALVYALDEKGALYFHRTPFYTRDALLQQYRLFLESVLYRRQASVGTAGGLDSPPRIEYWEIRRKRGGGFRLVEVKPGSWNSNNNIVKVQVIGELVAGNTQFTLYCDNVEFSYLEHGEKVLAKVAEHILALRGGLEPYPIYITDIDLSRVSKPDASSQVDTITYLHYKKQIEEALNQEAFRRSAP